MKKKDKKSRKSEERRREILLHLADNPEGLTATDLESELEISRPRIVKILQELASNELVKKKEGTLQYNRTPYQITEEGNYFLISEKITKVEIKRIASQTHINQYPYKAIISEILRDPDPRPLKEIVQILSKKKLNKRCIKACVSTLIKEGVLYVHTDGGIGPVNLFYFYPYLNEFSAALEERFSRSREHIIPKVEKYANNKKMPEGIKQKWIIWDIDPDTSFEILLKYIPKALEKNSCTMGDFLTPKYVNFIFEEAGKISVLDDRYRMLEFFDSYLSLENIKSNALTKEDFSWLLEVKIGLLKHDIDGYSEKLNALNECKFDEWFE